VTLRIRIEHGQHAGKAWRLAQDGVYVLGRLPSASIPVLDMKVSKDHCQLFVRGDGAETVLKDSGSRHGTLVNGQPVASKVRLKPGDEIRVGLSILRVLSDDESAEVAVPVGAAVEEQVVADKAAGTPAKKRKTYPADALVGTEIGGYKVLQKIGQGGMGAVYTAEQLSLHREVALKVLSEKFTSDNAFVDQFVNEARSAAALNHPNVVQVYDVGRENGRYYFSMEYVLGGSLEERLADQGPADWRAALNWMIDAANALIFAQKREILHRDVKPDNLMLAEDGSAKLCDLGLAKKAANEDMLAAGIIGTPAFISPEAIRRRKDIDVRSDLYSLGCTFFRVLTGENPYPGKTVKEILLGHLKAPVPRVSEKQPDTPRELDDVIYRLMQKEPEERYASAQDLLQALDRLRIQHGLEAHGLRPASRKPLVIALIAVLVLAAGALTFILTQTPEPTTVVDKEAQRKLEEDRRRLEEKEYETFLAAQRNELGKLELSREGGHLDQGDNWADADWPKLVGEYRAFAKQLEAHRKYGDRSEVKDLARKAREEAQAIEEYVDLRRGVDQDVKKGRAAAIERFTGVVQGVRRDFDAALAAGDWVKAYGLVAAEAIETLVKPYLEMQVTDVLPEGTPQKTVQRFGDSRLLDEKEHIGKVLEQYLPGDPVGQVLRDKVLAGVRQQYQELKREKEIATLREQTDPEKIENGIHALEGYVDGLPEAKDPRLAPLAELLASQREEAVKWVERLTRLLTRLKAANWEHDQVAYPTLLKDVRGVNGLLTRFQFAEARKHAEEAVAGLRNPEYRALGRQVVEDVAAVEHLFQRLVATFPDGWTRDRIDWTDDRGRDQSEKVREVTTTGIKLGSDDLAFETLGPGWIFRNVFTTKDGELRFAPEGEDHRGLAVLAEMAVSYDDAEKHYREYVTSLPPERQETIQAIRDRLGARLVNERQAGEAWRIATTNLGKVQAAIAAHDPAVIGEDAFWEDKTGREEFVARKKELNGLLDEARRAEAVLTDPKYASTVWVAVTRETIEPGVCYAGETPPVVEKPPEQPGGDQKPPDEGEKPPDDGTKPPDEGQKPPDDGTKPPDDGQKPPDDGQKPPDEDPQPPGNGGNGGDGKRPQNGSDRRQHRPGGGDGSSPAPGDAR